ncbi:unnamed protein product [Rotaria sp. Silwood2]|nr:unnamed protein product [Rotaria sp. Silwood2]
MPESHTRLEFHSQKIYKTKPKSISCSNRLDVDKELFLWSVINNRREFALLFWSRGKNKVCAALIATLLYKNLAHSTNDHSYYKSAELFENLASQIIDKFYQTNREACTKAVIQKVTAFGNSTWFEIAIAADAQEFITHRAVQDVLKYIWLGFIDRRISNFKIIFSTFMIWYSGFLRYHDILVQSNDENRSPEHQTNISHISRSQTSRRKETESRTKSKIQQYFDNISKFIEAPYVKYLYNLYFHMIFLLLFSYFILCDFFPLYEFPSDICAPTGDSKDSKDNVVDKNDNQPNIYNPLIRNEYNASTLGSYGFQRHKRPSAIEFVLLIWIFTLVCEEIRQMISTNTQSRRNAIITYFKNFWNELDILAIVVFFVGFILRFLPTVECFCAARIILSVDLAIWFIRSLSMFTALKQLGPKLVMIGEMVQDLKFFVLMLIVFILAFGVPSYSLIYGVQKFSWHLPRIILNHGFWEIFGELNVLETFSTNGYIVFFLLVAYMAVVSILMINLLIAMFRYGNNTFDRLQTNTDRIWKYQRYLLVSEYLSRPSLPPPLILFSHLWRLSLYILARYFKLEYFKQKYEQYSSRNKYKNLLQEEDFAKIELDEDACGDEVYYNFSKTGGQLVDETNFDEEPM